MHDRCRLCEPARSHGSRRLLCRNAIHGPSLRSATDLRRLGPRGRARRRLPRPSPAFQRSFQAIASIPSPSPTPAAQHVTDTLAAIPTASPTPGSLIPTQALAAIPPPAALTPTHTNGKNVLTLTPAETGQTAAVPIDTSIILRFGPGDHQISVSPATGVLEGPKGAFALPNDDIGILEAVGRGTATITVTSRRSATGTAGNSTSPNWSGYVASTGTYTSISGSWQVPSVQASTGFTASSSWIGIDGFNNTQPYSDRNGAGLQPQFRWGDVLRLVGDPPGARDGHLDLNVPGESGGQHVRPDKPPKWKHVVDFAFGHNSGLDVLHPANV